MRYVNLLSKNIVKRRIIYHMFITHLMTKNIKMAIYTLEDYNKKYKK